MVGYFRTRSYISTEQDVDITSFLIGQPGCLVGAVPFALASATVVSVVRAALYLTPAPEIQRGHFLAATFVARCSVLHATLDRVGVVTAAFKIADMHTFFLASCYRVFLFLTAVAL